MDCKACGTENVDSDFDYEIIDNDTVIGVITCYMCGKKLKFDVSDYIDFNKLSLHSDVSDWK